MSHADLVKRAEKWLRTTKGCSVVFVDFTTFSGEKPDAIGFQSGLSILVECKASRSDFCADRHKPWRRIPERGMGSQRYYMAPAGMINASEVPARWGLLEVHDRHVKVTKQSRGFADRSRPSEITFLVSMLRRAQLRINEPLSEWLKYPKSAKTN